jgi:hypothetical protein
MYEDTNNDTPKSNVIERKTSSRRAFLGRVGSAAAIAVAANAVPIAGQEKKENTKRDETSDGPSRADNAYNIRVSAAQRQYNVPPAQHPTNGDEDLYPNKIGTYTKGLPHNQLGEVNVAAYRTMLRALQGGRTFDFERIRLGDGRQLTNPQAGLAFEMQGPDSHHLTLAPPPSFNSAEEAGEMTEVYWQALTRDVNFLDYDTNPLTIAAATDLSNLSDFRGPKANGQVTTATLFRGNTQGDLAGPYISQFLWKDAQFGAEPSIRKMQTVLPNVDYMTSYNDWLAVQNGASTGPNLFDQTPRYIRNNRDLSQWVHVDVLFQGYFNALLILFGMNAPVSPTNPYVNSRTQIGFGTFGGPHIAAMVCGIASAALKAVWYQKWYVHRRLRPEAFGGRVHNHLTNATSYPIHQDVLSSTAVQQVFSRYGTYLLPMAFPEGSPTHPAYGAGHATVAGACVTVLKAWFDESFVIPNPVVPTADGTALVPYQGPALTVGSELNKLANNVAIGRNAAGVHWRSDATESLKLGEAVAIGVLSDFKETYNERFAGFTFTKFDGTRVTI